MSQENKAVVLRHHEQIWSKGHVDAVDDCYAADFVGHHPSGPDWIGRESVKLAVRMMHETFPDFAESVEDVIAEGDRVVTRFTSSGTHRGELGGIAPTGRRMSMAEFAVFRLAGGRIVEKWGLIDRLGMYQQLGVVPAVWPLMELLYEITMDVEVRMLGRRRVDNDGSSSSRVAPSRGQGSRVTCCPVEGIGCSDGPTAPGDSTCASRWRPTTVR
jgi:steroid delta-isomerase-like uncharacterized protein